MATLDPHAAQVLAAMASSGYPPMDAMQPADARAAAAMAFSSMQGPKKAVDEARDLNAESRDGAIPLRLYRPAGGKAGAALPAVVYFHGGGWVIGDLDVYDNFCRMFCDASGCVVVSVAYRLAPEHKFPAAADDAFDATVWISKQAATLGIDAQRLAVSGDSAGGNLAAVVSLMARDAGAPALKHQLLIYPATDMSQQSESYRVNGQDYFLTQSLMQWFGAHYLSSEADRSNWRASPLLAPKLDGLPSATVLVCGFDPLRDEGIAYSAALQKAGVAARLIRADDQIHGYLLMDAAIPAANQMVKELGAALRLALH